MLSNPNSNLHLRQRQHRRQNSTPSAFEPLKVSSLPKIQKHHGHRRGMSLDQRRRQTPPQDRMISHVSTGYLSTPQHILRETQQQRLICPGQQYMQYSSNDDSYLSSPVVTPHRLSLDSNYVNNYGEIAQPSQSYPYHAPMNWTMEINQPNHHKNSNFNLISSDPIAPTSTYLDFHSSLGEGIGKSIQGDFGRNSVGKRISDGIIDRVSQFENLALQVPHRPLTPSSHNTSSCFPPTPIDTPHVNMIKLEPTNVRFMDGYDTSMEETIKPSYKQRASGIFDDMRKELELTSRSYLSDSGTVKEHLSFDSTSLSMDNFMNLSNLHVELPDNENKFVPEPLFSPDSSDMPSILSGYQSSQEENQCLMITDHFSNSSNLENTSEQYPVTVNKSSLSFSSPRRKSTHRRFDSTSTINLEDSITETGITTDEIASYISGPEPGDGAKWLCLYPNCRKRFGRKENIKSHVQTHLGDRQFQCPFCKKCFVRQHDLKRHAKIHSGIKPYPCQCGNSFARHDALTRHRQRGMCIGAFEGTVKKAAKRGRPRKNRPNDVERLNKSTRTQKKNQEMSASSSISGCSESGDVSPRSYSRETSDVKSCVELDYQKAPLIISNASYQDMQSQLLSTNSLFSSNAETQCSNSFASSLNSSACSVSENTPVPDASQSQNETHHTNSYQSSPQMYESLSSPESLSNYFDMEPHQNGSEVHLSISNAQNLCSREEDLFLDVYPMTSQGPGLRNPRQDHDFLMGKYVDSLNQARGDDELFSSSQEVFYDA
ncbi:hypothetical protein EPUL_003869 [Erysiphe pulchra]|uniref:C2H2-type domain-containing protein n=1 Tax=Erysiphe pulchra TaxID=225359 RepID=A0A2S4PR62_9PEZI|nr:hypothetical protein EPUL_003869 [Erysiphe pulchra]